MSFLTSLNNVLLHYLRLPMCIVLSVSKLKLTRMIIVSEGCNSEGRNCFYEFPLDQQIKFLFERQGLAEAVEQFHEYRIEEEGVIKDICDGSEVRNIKKINCGIYDLTVLWNTDGISLDTNYRLWPLMFTICEIPVRLRPHFICVSSIWYDKREPLMKTFLQPFVKSLVDINHQGGISWTHPKTGVKIISQVTAPAAVADAPARTKLQDVKQYNAINGCNSCEITCTPISVKGKNRYYYVFSETPAKLRRGSRIVKHAQLALSAPSGSVKGVKGVSALYPVPNLDIGKFVFPEYMHSVLLGCVLSFTLLMRDMQVDWRLKKNLQEIDKVILSIKVPDFLKIPQGLRQLSKYKAHEVRAWLLYFSLPVLSIFIPEKYLQHWVLLVASICLLLQEEITENDLLAAELMLRMFVRDVGKLYGKSAYKYNTHQLLHLVLTVRRWGPLWANSAFMFKNFNGIISRMVHGTKHIAKELVNNLKIAAGLNILKSAVGRKARLCSEVLGHEAEYHFSETELSDIAEVSTAPFKVYFRAKNRNTIFTSKHYDETVKRCNSFVIVKIDGEQEIAQIVCFVKYTDSEQIWCLLDLYAVDHTRFFVNKATRFVVKNIVPLAESPQKRLFLPIAKIEQKVVRVLNFACICPNRFEVNL